MRILSVATTHPRFAGDSEASYVLDINRELVRLGHEVHALLPHAAGAALREAVDGVGLVRFRYFVPAARQRLCYDGGILPNLRRRWWARVNLPFFLASQAVAVARAARRLRPDLVHCHWLLSSGLMGVLFGGRRSRPVVVSAHGSDVYTDAAPFRLANRFVLGHCDLCTVNSRGTRERVRSIHGGVEPVVVPMGIHLESYGPERATPEARERLGGGRPQVVFIGRFSEHKGVSHLIAAMPAVLAALPGARLALVGFGPEETRLRRRVAELGLERAVRFTGPVAHSEVPGVLASADLVVLPSVKVEGLGVVLLEALASGTPVVGSEVGGIPDIVRDGETGLLARAGDPGDLALRCIRLLTDEPLRRRTTAEGRRLVASEFGWDRIARRFDELFHDCVGRRLRSPETSGAAASGGSR